LRNDIKQSVSWRVGVSIEEPDDIMGCLNKRREGSRVDRRSLVDHTVKFTTQCVLFALEAADFFQSGMATRQVGQSDILISHKHGRKRLASSRLLAQCHFDVLKPALKARGGGIRKTRRACSWVGEHKPLAQ
jgi:hypothetical protein